MTSTFDLNTIKKALAEEKLDGWLFYDYQGSDPIGRRILHFRKDDIQSRRWFYLIPANGVPVKLVNGSEKDALDHLPGKKLVYMNWQELTDQLGRILEPVQRIAMQYSPKNRIPSLARVDAGTAELVKSFRKRIYSSANLVQFFEARLDSKELNSHIYVSNILRQIVDSAFTHIGETFRRQQHLTEAEVQKFIMEKLRERDFIFERLPAVAAGINTTNPRYTPQEKASHAIRHNQVIQLEIWAKEAHDYAVYATLSWVGYVSDGIPENVGRLFEIVRTARDKAVAFIDNAINKGRIIHGWQVDEFVRKYIQDEGYGPYYIHRTGQSLGKELYGYGANMDNLDCKDERRIIPETCFSIAPGLYMKDFGMRTAVNVYASEKGTVVYGAPVQKKVVAVLAG